MPVPKRKTSKARRDKRSAGKRKARGSVASCQTCKEPIACHSVCKSCGYYRGIKVLRTRAERVQSRDVSRRVKSRPLDEASAVKARSATPVEAETVASKDAKE